MILIGILDFIQRFIAWTNRKVTVHFERTVVIVKKFSKDILFVIPTTTKTKVGTWYQPIEYGDVKTQAILAQARTISAKRLIRIIGNLSPEQFQPLIKGFVALIKTNSPT